MGKKKNWDILSKMSPTDTTRYRDVYEDQQLERSEIGQKQSPTLRIIFVVIVGIVCAILGYVVASGISYASKKMNSGFSEPDSTDVVYEMLDYPDGTLRYNPNNPDNYVTYDYQMVNDKDGYPIHVKVYQALDINGNPFGDTYATLEEVPIPDWYVTSKADYERMIALPEVQALVKKQEASARFNLSPSFSNICAAILCGFGVSAILYPIMMRNLAAQNLMNDTTDINQYKNDQHIALPEEIQRKFDWFPDAGAHCSVQVSSMISHVALENKGISNVDISVRATKDILDEDGDVLYLKGEVLRDDDDKVITKSEPMFDKDFMETLFDASGLPNDKKLRKYYNPSKIEYNPDNKYREKLPGYKTVADMINKDWEIPWYETQRPGGAYLVDVEPVNTMV